MPKMNMSDVFSTHFIASVIYIQHLKSVYLSYVDLKIS